MSDGNREFITASPLGSFPVFSSAVPVLLSEPLPAGVQRRRAAAAADRGGEGGPGHAAHPAVQRGTVPATVQDHQQHQGLEHHGQFMHDLVALKVMKFAFSGLGKLLATH